METQSFGQLLVRCTAPGQAPIPNATISIASPSDPNKVIEQLRTDGSGLTQVIELDAPPVDYSLSPSEQQPYSEYNIQVTAQGFQPSMFSGVEILADVTAEQDADLTPVPAQTAAQNELFVIGPHTLYGEYPPKIPEPEIKPTFETGEIVLPQVVIPEFVIVHDGPPSDSSAPNNWVRFRDYIKNVACSEIYATWPENTIYANIFAILSFTLNRVFTEWYRNQGYNFTITSSTAYDHKWINGRNIFSNVGYIVDSIFTNYLSRPNVKQPILTQYCDGNRVQCPGWMTQWGSKSLGDQGYSAIQILRYYYGNTIYINSASEVSGVPRSWPGYNLTIGASGDSVRMIQQQLNRVAQVYSAIPTVAVDGSYGQKTSDAVKAFQRIFGLPVTGVVDLPTWYKISQIYVGVTRIGQ
ncbi:MAG TPA: peptidoglycan-binding protein [Mobilitalea sp.]|nr:peptidoglycan-binding protein [Mobilitalea sp.]